MQNKLVILKQTKYLSFIVKEDKPKTKVIAVVNKTHQEEIGVIRWYGAWRQYCFFPHHNTVWNKGCLNDVNDMIIELTPVKPKPRQKNIAVITKDCVDFQQWRNLKKYKSTGENTLKRFVRGNSRYVCMTKPQDVCGYTIDKVIETERAFMNPKYSEIMTSLSHCMISQKKKP